MNLNLKIKEHFKYSVNKYIRNLYYFFALLFFSSALNASDSLRVISGKQEYFPGLSAEYLEDPAGNLTIEDLLDDSGSFEWRKSEKKVMAFGFSHSVYWIRFTAENRSFSENMILEVMYPLLDYIDLYTVRYSGSKPEVAGFQTAGDMRPFSDRDIKYRNSVFETNVNEKTVYYLKIRSESSLEISLALRTKNGFTKKIADELLLFGVYFGVLFIMVGYNAILAFILRDKTYLFYILYILSAIFTQAALLGFTGQFLFPDQPLIANLTIPSWLHLDLFWGTLFAMTFLNTKEHLPGMHRILLVVLGITLLGSGLVLLLGYASAMKISLLLLLVIPALLFIAGILTYLRGIQTARVFLLAWASLLAAIATASLKASGIIPSNFITDNAVYFGTAIEVVLLSVALADRINLIEKEKEEALEAKLAESEKVASLSNAFKKFVPHEFIECLDKEDVTKLSLGDGVDRYMTLLFADIRSFTTLSEKMTPKETFDFINSYLGRMQPLISKNHGFIDKYLGDAIMALFDKSADDALRTSVEMHSELIDYNRHRNAHGLPALNIGIGINTGLLLLGIIGGRDRMESTVVADAVNLASRVEGLTKTYGSRVILTENTYNTLTNPDAFTVRALDKVRVRGKSEPILIYELLDAESEESRQRKQKTEELFSKGRELYEEKRFTEGLEFFLRCQAEHPDDKAALFHINRGRSILQTGIDSSELHMSGVSKFN